MGGKWIEERQDVYTAPAPEEKLKRRRKTKEIKEGSEISEEEAKELMQESYDLIIKMLKKYCDLNEDYYPVIACWIIGTYFHDKLPTYPYLFLNATKGSGKSRTLNLIVTLSKDGKMLNSIRESTLFRTKGTLAIDEFEDIGRKGFENLRELLNSAYKKGISVIRMKKVKTQEGEEQVAEEFEVYRPLLIANIWGMESVLGDRCVTLVLERSDKKHITDLIEIFGEEKETIKIKENMEKCSKCSFMFSWELYKEWNNFVINNNTNYTNHTNYTNYTNYTNLFKKVKFTGIGGRDLELFFPLIMIANQISDEILNKTTLILSKLHLSKKEEEFNENNDVGLVDFISQEPQKNTYVSLKDITKNFSEFIQINEDWLNTKWMGRALKRLALIKEKRRRSYGIEYILDYEKAQEKIKMFK